MTLLHIIVEEENDNENNETYKETYPQKYKSEGMT
jgi:hypothetical protein